MFYPFYQVLFITHDKNQLERENELALALQIKVQLSMNKFNTENIMHNSLLFIHFAEWQKTHGRCELDEFICLWKLATKFVVIPQVQLPLRLKGHINVMAGTA